MNFKSFNDLVFKKEYLGIQGTEKEHAVMFFPNGYGISVVKGYGAYGTPDKPYECACLYRDAEGSSEYTMAYSFLSEWGDSVKGFCTEQDVTEIMKRIQLLKI